MAPGARRREKSAPRCAPRSLPGTGNLSRNRDASAPATDDPQTVK